MGWFDSWFVNSWFGTIANVPISCAVEALWAKTDLPAAAVRTDQRLVSGKTPLTGYLEVITPGVSLGTKPGAGTQTLSGSLPAPTVMTVIRRDVAVAAEAVTTGFLAPAPEGRTASRMAASVLNLNGIPSVVQLRLGARIPTQTLAGSLAMSPIGTATGVRLSPDGLGARWSLPQKGMSVIIEI